MGLNAFGVSLLRNIAPVDPNSVLSLLEGVISKENSHIFFHVRMIITLILLEFLDL